MLVRNVENVVLDISTWVCQRFILLPKRENVADFTSLKSGMIVCITLAAMIDTITNVYQVMT